MPPEERDPQQDPLSHLVDEKKKILSVACLSILKSKREFIFEQMFIRGGTNNYHLPVIVDMFSLHHPYKWP